MYRRTALTAAVSLVAASAGCTGSEEEQPSDSESEDSDGIEAENAESANGDEEELTLETFEYPEAVDLDGFRRNLGSVHAERLEAAGSFRLVREIEETSGGFTSERERTVTVDGDTFHLTSERGNGFRSTDVWSDSATDGSTALIRGSNGSGERYRIDDRSQFGQNLDGAETLDGLIDAAMFEASELEERDGTPVVVFESVDVIDASALGDATVHYLEEYDDLEASIDVSEAGVVGYEYELTGEGYDGSTVITESATFEGVGETDLEAPEWVDEGWERALEMSIEPTADESAFVATIERGEPIPAGAQLSLYVGQSLSGRLDREVTQEDTLYLYNDGGGRLGVSVNSEPTPDSPINTDFADFSVYTDEGLVAYRGTYRPSE